MYTSRTILFIGRSTGSEVGRNGLVPRARTVYVVGISFILSSQVDLNASRRDAFICFINSEATTQSLAIQRRNNEKDRGFSLSPRRSGGTDTMGPMTCYNCALAAQHGLLPATCQFECPIAFTLEARDGLYMYTYMYMCMYVCMYEGVEGCMYGANATFRMRALSRIDDLSPGEAFGSRSRLTTVLAENRWHTIISRRVDQIRALLRSLL